MRERRENRREYANKRNGFSQQDSDDCKKEKTKLRTQDTITESL